MKSKYQVKSPNKNTLRILKLHLFTFIFRFPKTSPDHRIPLKSKVNFFAYCQIKIDNDKF